MPSYTCCYPGCGNTLISQGPISASIMQDGEMFNLEIVISSNGFLAADTIEHFRNFLPDKSGKDEVKIISPAVLQGAKQPFKIGEMKLFGDFRQGRKTPVTQTITLCCEECHHCCDYTI